MYGIRYVNLDGEEDTYKTDAKADAERFVKTRKAWGYRIIDFIHAKKPVAPSTVKLNGTSGYYNDVIVGWKEIESSRIDGDGFVVRWYRYADRTIDRMCDALNGWHTYWEQRYKAVLTDKLGTAELILRGNETADLFFDMAIKCHGREDEDGTTTDAEVVRILFRYISNYIEGEEVWRLTN